MFWFIVGFIMGTWLSFRDWRGTADRLHAWYEERYSRRQEELHPFLRDEKVNLKLWGKGDTNGKKRKATSRKSARASS